MHNFPRTNLTNTRKPSTRIVNFIIPKLETLICFIRSRNFHWYRRILLIMHDEFFFLPIVKIKKGSIKNTQTHLTH